MMKYNTILYKQSKIKYFIYLILTTGIAVVYYFGIQNYIEEGINNIFLLLGGIQILNIGQLLLIWMFYGSDVMLGENTILIEGQIGGKRKKLSVVSQLFYFYILSILITLLISMFDFSLNLILYILCSKVIGILVIYSIYFELYQRKWKNYNSKILTITNYIILFLLLLVIYIGDYTAFILLLICVLCIIRTVYLFIRV